MEEELSEKIAGGINAVGIVAEFNPFHSGHAYLINKTREHFGENAVIVCCMSGDFVQRGEWACRDKFDRTRAALEGGADLVIELPLPWCLSSSEGFARGAVGLLRAAGCSALAFGSECGDIDALRAFRCDESGVKAYMAANPACTYPEALRTVSESSLLDGPNNLLAIDYLKFAGDMRLFTVKRETPHDGPSSAKAIRETMTMPDLEKQAVSRLKMFDLDYYLSLPDASGGPGKRLFDAVGEASALEEIAELAKTRRYTMSRIRRMMMCAVLGVKAGMNAEIPPYIRVLGFNAAGRSLLKEKKPLPVITQSAAIALCDEKSREIFALGAAAHEFYALSGTEKKPVRRGEDYRFSPIVV